MSERSQPKGPEPRGGRATVPDAQPGGPADARPGGPASGPGQPPPASPERIAQIRGEAERAIAAADSREELEAARIRYLGRRAELPNLLRRVAELPAERRAEIGR